MGRAKLLGWLPNSCIEDARHGCKAVSEQPLSPLGRAKSTIDLHKQVGRPSIAGEALTSISIAMSGQSVST